MGSAVMAQPVTEPREIGFESETGTRDERRQAAALVERWILRGAAFLFPLAFLPNLVSEFVLPKLLLLRLLIVVFTILLLVRWVRQEAISWRRTPIDIPLAAFVISAAISTVFAVNRNLAIFGGYDRWEGLLTITSYALLFWLTVQMLSGQRDARGLVWALLISGYVVGAIAILQSGFGVLGGGYWRDAGTGIIRADVTLAHPDFAGIFLAMLIPVAAAKVVSHRSFTRRLLAANIFIVMALGLLATFTRAAWVAAAIGVVAVLTIRQGRFHAWPVVIAVVVLTAGLLSSVALAETHPSAPTNFGRAVVSRIASITDVSSGSEASRLQTWRDTLPLIAARPILGWGPDSFGLTYPLYQSTSRHGEFFDKAHQEALGIAASQGLVGLAAYVWILIAFIRSFWRGRFVRGAAALFAGFLAYEAAIQVDFSWIPTAIPFWLLAAAAIVTWTPDTEPVTVALLDRRVGAFALAGGSAVLVALLIPAVIVPYLADAKYYATPAAPSLEQARSTIAQARQLVPYEATYATEAGNYALNLDSDGIPASNADWPAARQAYETAARLGSVSPEMFQLLAVVDEHLGDHPAALAAARRAVELDRYDPYSRVLLNNLTRKDG